jgi:hypothetical protein
VGVNVRHLRIRLPVKVAGLATAVHADRTQNRFLTHLKPVESRGSLLFAIILLWKGDAARAKVDLMRLHKRRVTIECDDRRFRGRLRTWIAAIS